MLDLLSLSAAELKEKLRAIARQCRTEADFKARVAEAAPGLAVTCLYCGPMFVGMAMSHCHEGIINF